MFQRLKSDTSMLLHAHVGDVSEPDPHLLLKRRERYESRQYYSCCSERKPHWAPQIVVRSSWLISYLTRRNRLIPRQNSCHLEGGWTYVCWATAPALRVQVMPLSAREDGVKRIGAWTISPINWRGAFSEPDRICYLCGVSSGWLFPRFLPLRRRKGR